MRTIRYGNKYWKLHEDGRIERPEIGLCSENWKILGAVTLNNFGHIIQRFSLKDILERAHSIPWTHKNGKQWTHIIDYDHGSQRMWCSPTHEVF
jgi:hypothetical protein